MLRCLINLTIMKWCLTRLGLLFLFLSKIPVYSMHVILWTFHYFGYWGFISILSPLYNLVHHFQPNYYRKSYLTVEKHNLFHSSVTSETGGGYNEWPHHSFSYNKVYIDWRAMVLRWDVRSLINEVLDCC